MKLLNKFLSLSLAALTPTLPMICIVSCGGDPEDPTKCKITFDGNGGSYDGKTTTTYTIPKLQYYGQVKDKLPTPTRSLYKFKGYSEDKVNIIDDSYQFKNTSCKLYAMWETETTVQITFDGNGGTISGETSTTKEIVSGTLLKDVEIDTPIYTGHTFGGWTIDETVVLDDNYALSATTTIKANWIDGSTKYTITVDENQETTTTTTLSISQGTVIKNMDVSSFKRDNYTFRCFGNSQGVQISNNTIIKNDMNVKIWWNCDSTIQESTPQEYIYNRSFSIARGTFVGTCWIIADATPNDLTDYQYYIATNLHVRVNLENEEGNYKFSDSKEVLDPTSGTYYTDFTSLAWEDKQWFTYDTSKPQDAIDLSIAKADFSSATSDTKTKLDNLNKKQGIEGCITEFADSVSTSTHHEALTNLTTAGYGATNTNGYQWEEHNNLNLEFIYYFAAGHSTQDLTYSNDASPQYKLKGEEVGYMHGGSSGSILVAKDSNSKYKVLAIYWGGVTEHGEGSTTGLLMFSCFSSDKKDFIDRYCTYHKNY